jgi:hypothetical protein
MLVLGSSARATIIEVGDLNIIDDAGNSSDGLRFLDMTYSDGLTMAAALTNAQATYPNARLATPDEWDDLFAAAGVTYSGSETASAGFDTGAIIQLTASGDAGVGVLRAALGATTGEGHTFMWTDPDGSIATSGTRDVFFLGNDDTAIASISVGFSDLNTGWLLVSEVPEPGTFSMLALGFLALGVRGRRAAVH